MAAAQRVKRVFILGMDGAGNFIQQTPTPHMDAFAKKGVITYAAQSESPTISAECWGSILHGVTPDKHGLNNDIAAKERYPSDSPHPSIFRLAREQRPEAKLASFTGWSPINDGIIEEDLDIHKVSMPDAELVAALATYIQENQDLTLLFLQLDEPDGAGHRHGYGPDSPEYLEMITLCDERMGQVLDAIEKSGMMEDSLILLVTDHGGGGAYRFGHGSDHPMDKNVFWACAGPCIEQGKEVGAISIRDTAAVAAYALGLQLPENWDSRLPEGLFRA